MIDINKLIREAMKSNDRDALRTYQNLKTEIQLVKTAKNAKEYTEAVEIQLLSKMCKKLEDAIISFSDAGRDDLVSSYTIELHILQKLLPKPVSESEICSAIILWCAKNGYCDGVTADCSIPKKEMGITIKAIKDKYPNADGKLIAKIVKSYVV